MSLWLKTRLLSLVCGALLVGGATYLRAQEDYGPPAKTPEEAATNFWKFLDFVRKPTDAGRSPWSAIDARMKKLKTITGSIMRSQYESLNSRHPERPSPNVLELLATQAVTPVYEGQVDNSSSSQTVVSVTPSIESKAREVVVVREEGGYRVDIVATYARWHHLTGLDADKALFKATGWISPNLARQPGIIGSETIPQCQAQLKQIGLAVLQYTQDYDGRLPPARRWQDLLSPYMRSEAIYTCPALVTQAKRGGYAFNSNLSQVALRKLEAPTQTVLLYETSNLKRNVFAPFTGRAYRHASYDTGNGLNVAFSDGHVKWYESGVDRSLIVTADGKNMLGAG